MQNLKNETLGVILVLVGLLILFHHFYYTGRFFDLGDILHHEFFEAIFFTAGLVLLLSSWSRQE